MRMITEEEAEQWLNNMSRETQIQMIREHDFLKQGLCAQVLTVPTGSKDWIRRTMVAVDNLQNTCAAFNILRGKCEIAIDEANEKVYYNRCYNCLGSGAIESLGSQRDKEQCSVCRGTGRSKRR